MATVLERARVLADEVLFPAAPDVDADEVIPSSHFTRLAEEGFYGLAGSVEDGGAEVDLPTMAGVLETLAGGCLTTAFTWMQHHAAVRGLTRTANAALRQAYLGAAIRGELRAGVIYAGAIPRPPRLWATATDGGWLLRGDAPLVTGWGLVDVLSIFARDTAAPDGTAAGEPAGEPARLPAGEPSGAIVNGLIDATAGGGITVEELRMIAAQGSNTVRLRFADYFLPTERVVAGISPADFLPGKHVSGWLNGCLAMGIADRCLRMLDEAGHSGLVARLRGTQQALRQHLEAGLADPSALPAARAAASEFAYRVAGALVAAVGSTGILHRQHAQRLAREAVFTLVAAGRPEIKSGLLELFGRSPG